MATLQVNAAKKTLIRIGHPSYTGANASKYCFSKASAVRELHSRGIKRDVARATVNDVAARFGGYATLRGNGFNVIEVGNYSDEA